MKGLKRGTVELHTHERRWEQLAEQTILRLRTLFGEAAVDIQHVGSTAIPSIPAKPIIDIAVGVDSIEDLFPFENALKEKDIIFRGSDQPGQLLLVMGDFEADTRTHHIHVVVHDSEDWQNYLNFRDYLISFPEKAKEYAKLKKALAETFSSDRGSYTAGKQQLIDRLLLEAKEWRQSI